MQGMPVKARSATVWDKPTNQYCMVAGGMYTLNGCEPQIIPADLRELEPREIAKKLLEIHLGRRRVA